MFRRATLAVFALALGCSVQTPAPAPKEPESFAFLENLGDDAESTEQSRAEAAQAAADAAMAAAEALEPTAAGYGERLSDGSVRYYVQPQPTFYGYPCTEDCSGHDAGYEWAEQNDISDPYDCDGKSGSFIEGCEAYAEEQQEEQRRQEEEAAEEERRREEEEAAYAEESYDY